MAIGLFGYPEASGSDMQLDAIGLVINGVVAAGRTADPDKILTTLASRSGNSGDPVFLVNTGEVIGMHKGELIPGQPGREVPPYSIAVSILALKDIFLKLGIIKGADKVKPR